MIIAFFSYLVGLLLNIVNIRIQKRLKFKQIVRAEGPESHKVKNGTPTMGGIAIILAIFLSLQWFPETRSTEGIIVIGTMLGFFLIGLIDDGLIVIRKNNKGIPGKLRLLIEIGVAGIFVGYLNSIGHYSSAPEFLQSITFHSVYIYDAFLLVLLVGTANSVNLTDGLDALVTGLLMFSFTAYIYIGYKLGLAMPTLLSLVSVGALFSFLWFNINPAKIFMGDTGALPLGYLLGMVAVLTHTELLLLVIGGIYLVETLSVMIQVTVFKRTGKRVFKMTPIHHHFELSGSKETEVVYRFWYLGLILSLLGIVLFIQLYL